MTLLPSKLQLSDFSDVALLSQLPLGSHDAVISGDTLTSLTINSEWRKFLAHAVDTYLRIGTIKASQAQLDALHPLIGNLFDDFYSGGASPVIEKLAVRGVLTGVVTLTANVEKTLDWTSIAYDFGDFHDVGTPDEFVVPVGKAGVYQVVCGLFFAAASNGNRHIHIKLNDVILSMVYLTTSGAWLGVAVYEGELDDGDVITIEALSTTATNLLGNLADRCYVAISRKFDD